MRQTIFYISFGLAILSGLFVSCDKRASQESVCENVIDLMGEFPPVFVDSVKEIALHGDSTTAVGDVSKIICWGDNMFVLDKRTRSVWKFNESGQLINRLYKLGTGPGEYGRADDIDVDRVGNRYVLDANARKILRYDSQSMDYISEMRFSDIVLSFCVVDSSLFYVNKAGDNAGITVNLGTLTPGTKKVSPVIMTKVKDEHLFPGEASYLWRSGDDLLYFNRFTPDLYTLRGDTVENYAAFISDGIPTEKQISEQVQKTLNHDYSSIEQGNWDITYAYKTGDGMMFGLNTFPIKHLYQNFRDNNVYEVKTSKDPRFYGVATGAIGVWNDFFVTFKMPGGDEDFSVVLYKLASAD